MVKVLSFRLQQGLGLFTLLVFEGSSEKGLFIHLSNIVFRSPLVQKHISYEGHFFVFLKMFKIKSGFPKCANKIEKKFFVSEIFVSEDVAINCLY